jgi:hypothetical protein
MTTKTLTCSDQYPLHKKFYQTTSPNSKGVGSYKKYRVVRVDEDLLEIHQVCCQVDIGIPKWLGGRGLSHDVFFWEHGTSFTRGRETYPTEAEAIVAIKEAIALRSRIYHSYSLGQKKVAKCEVLGVYNA